MQTCKVFQTKLTLTAVSNKIVHHQQQQQKNCRKSMLHRVVVVVVFISVVVFVAIAAGEAVVLQVERKNTVKSTTDR